MSLRHIGPKNSKKTSFFNTFLPILNVFVQYSQKLSLGHRTTSLVGESGVVKAYLTKKIRRNIIFQYTLTYFGQKMSENRFRAAPNEPNQEVRCA